MRTYLTHLGTRGSAVINFPDKSTSNVSSPTKGEQSKGPSTSKSTKGKKKGKIDTLKDEIEKKSDELITYLIKVRKYAFVCKTKKMDKRAIKVVKQFYVDEFGNTISDAERDEELQLNSNRVRVSSLDGKK